MRKNRRKKKSRVSYLVYLILAFTVASALYLYNQSHPRPPVTKAFILERTWKNYGDPIQDLAEEFNIPASYLLALIVLECSGQEKEDIEPRFENHVYKKLKTVRDNTSASYGSITQKTIFDSSDDALKNLATSWGPFQLMGYQCIELGVNVADIRGKQSLYWGVYWINERYGNNLRANDFKNAFHIHNAGHHYPKTGGPNTHDPKYVENGIHYAKYFEHKLNK